MRSVHRYGAQVRQYLGISRDNCVQVAQLEHSRVETSMQPVHNHPQLWTRLTPIVRRFSTEQYTRTTAILSDLCALSTGPISNKQ